MMLSELYTNLLHAFYEDLEETFFPAIFEHQNKSNDLDKMEMLSKKRGSHARQPFTWRLSAIATQMSANRLPRTIQLQFFAQALYYVGSKLWNKLLEQPELCTYNFGFHLKYAVSELRSWVSAQGLHDESCNPAHQLNRVLDAAGVLVVGKNFFEEAKIPQDVLQAFPSLSLREIKFLLDNYVPDKSAQEKNIPTSVRRKLDAAAQKEGPVASLKLDPLAAFPSPGAAQESSSSSSSKSKASGKEKRRGR